MLSLTFWKTLCTIGTNSSNIKLNSLVKLSGPRDFFGGEAINYKLKNLNIIELFCIE